MSLLNLLAAEVEANDQGNLCQPLKRLQKLEPGLAAA